MLQIAIWGMAIMLVVKAIELLQREALAVEPSQSSHWLTGIGVLAAIAGAVVLVALAGSQASEMPSSIGGY